MDPRLTITIGGLTGLACMAQVIYVPLWARSQGRSGAAWFMLTFMWTLGYAGLGFLWLALLFQPLFAVLVSTTAFLPTWALLFAGKAATRRPALRCTRRARPRTRSARALRLARLRRG